MSVEDYCAFLFSDLPGEEGGWCRWILDFATLLVRRVVLVEDYTTRRVVSVEEYNNMNVLGFEA